MAEGRNPLQIGPEPADSNLVGGVGAGQRTDAMALIQAGEQAYPPELRATMQRHRDESATAGLDMEALSSQYGVRVLTAAVYGLPDQDQQVVYLYETESGRTARWYAPYEAKRRRRAEPEPEPSGEPWPGYDGQSVAEVTAYLDDHEEVDSEVVRAYEQEHKARKGVLDHLDSLER
jgi:hypothetical protein